MDHLASGPWPLSVKHGFILMEWALYPDIGWSLPQVLCLYCTSTSFRQDTIIDGKVCSWVVLYLSPLVACRAYSSILVSRRKKGTSSSFPHLVSCVGFVFSIRALTSFLENNQWPWWWLGLFGGSRGATLANNSIIYNPFPELKGSFGGERYPVGAQFPWLFGKSI